MDYEKLYKEALERARDVYTYYCDDREQLRKIESIFPELAESEDERIRKALITYFQRFPYPYGGIESAGTNAKEALAWLEKKGEKPKGKSALEAINEKKSDNANKVDDFKFELNFDFSVGQWIVACGKKVFLITKIDGFNITLFDTNGDKYVFDVSSLKDARFWDITKDAKECDVLASKNGNEILIFRKLDSSTSFSSYYNINKKGEFGWYNRSFIPATKDQRDTLLKAMADAGYTFDFEKKELKKIGIKE